MAVLLGTAVLITVAAVLAEDTSPQFECNPSHESYNLTSEAPLGIYTQYGASVDHQECSTIAKYEIKIFKKKKKTNFPNPYIVLKRYT